MSIPIARSAKSARRMGRVMVGTCSALGKRPGVRLSGRLGLRRRVSGRNLCEILVRSLTLPAAGAVLWPGRGRLGDGYGGRFGNGLKGLDRGLGFKVSVSYVVVVKPGCEAISPFVVCRHC